VTDPSFPAFADGALEGWTLVEESVDTVFELPTMSVKGATRRYEDEALRAAVREATDGELDHEWRFVAATKLGFDPGLPPGTMPSMVLPSVRSEARRNFKRRLKTRGIENVERANRERMRIGRRTRVRLTRYDGVDPAGEVPVSGWVGAWNDGADFYVVTGGYPAEPLGDALGTESADESLSVPPHTMRDELLDVFGSVE
jgi:hypothetical protein